MSEPTNHLSPPKHRFRWEVIKYATSFIIIVGGIGAFLFLKSMAKPPETQQTDALIQQVDTYEVQPYSGLLDMVVTGTVVPHREIKIAAEVGGRVKEKYAACEAGNYVTKGEKLVQIDPKEYELEIKILKAEVEENLQRILGETEAADGQPSNIELAEHDLKLQKQELERNKKLSGALSQTELDQAQRAFNAAQTQLTNRKSNLATLKAGTARMERKLEMAQLNLSRTTITAPEDGIIVREIVQEGDFVSKGTQIVMFEDTERSEVLCNLTPTDLNWIRDHSIQELDLIENDPLAVYRLPKTDVTIYDPDEPEVTWRGTLERFDGIGRDEITKTIPCRIAVENPIVQSDSGPRALVRGMYVKCRVEVQTTSGEKGQNLFSFPALALHPSNQIWIVDGNQQLKSMTVDVVDWTEVVRNESTEDFVVVTTPDDSLQAGDLLVTSPLSQPTDRAPVVFRDEPTVDPEDKNVPKVASDLTVSEDGESQVSAEAKSSSFQ